jgi:hypothetical protein
VNVFSLIELMLTKQQHSSPCLPITALNVRLWFRIRLNDEPIRDRNRITIMALKRDGCAGLGKDRRNGEGVVSKEPRSMGVELCAWVLDVRWRMKEHG